MLFKRIFLHVVRYEKEIIFRSVFRIHTTIESGSESRLLVESRSRSRFLMTENLKKFQIKQIFYLVDQNCNLFMLHEDFNYSTEGASNLPKRTSSTSKHEISALRIVRHFFCMDPDPDSQSGSESGFKNPITSVSNPGKIRIRKVQR